MGFLQWIRSALFLAQAYPMMAIMALWFTPQVPFRPDAALRAVQCWCRYVRWTARWMTGLHSEIRGEVPQGDVLIASKHQSFFDIILLVSVLPRARFIMKRELLNVPILGWYARRIGCIPVDRGKRSQAMKQMLSDVAALQDDLGQLVIYPQGTRVAPGAREPYKIGAAVLYGALKRDCVPVATNVGLFWPKSGVMRRPGVAVIEFLSPIPAGERQSGVLAAMEEQIETASDRLMSEAGFVLPGPEAAVEART